MVSKDLDSWEQFETFLQELKAVDATRPQAGYVSSLLFRGQSDANWSLQTTLDRTAKGTWSCSEYFRLIHVVRPQVETFTGLRWELGELRKMEEWAASYDSLRLMQSFPAYDYLVFLRHHGFPSPLLDWSQSPHVAAFFAFRQVSTGRVAIYVYREHAGQGKVRSSDKPQIIGLGPYIRSHPRHFLQQSEYTVSALFHESAWQFTAHESVFEAASGEQDLLWKVTIPATERLKVLKALDAYNLNAFSLFQTEEALLSTLALREIDFASYPK